MTAVTRQAPEPGRAQEAPKAVRQKRRSLADGPSVRQALAQAEAESKRQNGWKLLESPESIERSEACGLLKTIDDTQPEPDWKVLGVTPEATPAAKVGEKVSTQSKAQPKRHAYPPNAPRATGATSPTRATPANRTGTLDTDADKRQVTPVAGVPRPGGGGRTRVLTPEPATSRNATPRAPRVTPPSAPSRVVPAAASPDIARPLDAYGTGGKPAPGPAHPPRAEVSIPRPRPRMPSAPAVPLPLPQPSSRGMMATQMGLAPPPKLEAALATNATPHNPPAQERVNAALAATQLDTSRPAEIDALLEKMGDDLLEEVTSVAPPPDELLGRASRTTSPGFAPGGSPADLLKPRATSSPGLVREPPATTRSSELLGFATTQKAGSLVTDLEGADPLARTEPPPAGARFCPAPSAVAAMAPHTPHVPPTDPSAVSQTADTAIAVQAEPAFAPPAVGRGPLPSDVCATSHDTLPPLPMAGIKFELPKSLSSLSRKQLVGLASVGVVAAMVPLVFAAIAVTSLIGSSDPPAETADTPTKTPTTTANVTAAPAAKAKAGAAPGAAPAKVATPAPAPSPPPRAAAAAKASAAPIVTDDGARQQTPAPAAEPAAPPVPRAPGKVPWDDQPNTKTAACESLTTAPVGPKAFLIQKAIKTGQRELIRGNVKAAHVAFCEAALLDNPSETVLLGLAQVLLMQADFEGALKASNQLVELKAGDARSLELRGDILVRMGRVDDARQDWYRAAGASRGSASLIANLSRVARSNAKDALRAGDLARADRMWRRAVALNPTDVDACVQLATVLNKNDQGSAAQRWVAYAESLDPSHPKLDALKAALNG